jgi:PD-(D/E)XK nuclease superfamily
MFSSRRSPYLPQINAKQTQIEPLSHRETTCRIIGAAFEVHNTLGHGFLEKVYQRAMQVELIKRGSSAQTETSIQVLYKNAVVGRVLCGSLRRWLRDRRDQSSEVYHAPDEAQLLNQLKATGIKVGVRVNFGRERVEYKRMIF